MLEKTSTSVKFLAFFTASKQGSTGLTVTVDVYDPAGTKIVDASAATELAGGLYTYTLSSSNSTAGEYVAIFKTTDSNVDAQHVPSLWVLGRAGVENLDAAVSTRSTLTAEQVNSEADTALADVGLTSAVTGRIDQAISTRLAAADYVAPSAAPSVVDIRQEMDANSTKLANLDASISSRLADADYVAPTTPPTAAEIATAVEGSLLNEGDGQAVLNAIVGAIGNSNVDEIALVAAIRSDLERAGGKLDSIPTTSAPSASTVAGAVRTELTTELSRIDQTISSRLASADYTAPTAAPSAAQNASAVRSELSVELARLDAPVSGATAPSAATVASAVRTELSTELGRVDAAVSSRLASSAATDLAAVKAKTDALNTERLANVPTVNILGTLLAQANS